MKRFKDTFGCAILLNLLLPGSGHLYWREYLFGIFVFLVSLLAVILWFVSYLVPLNLAAKLLLFGLPLVFYGFTFVDLRKTMRKKLPSARRTTRVTSLLLVGALLFQVFVPLTPVNFGWRNRPVVYEVPSNRYHPYLENGSLVSVWSSDYHVHLPFVDHPIWLKQPRSGDLVCYTDRRSRDAFGVVLGMPGEEIQVIDGTVVVNGLPVEMTIDGGLKLRGDMGLTLVDSQSILIATLNMGAVDATHQVALGSVKGRVHRLF